jgi:Fe-S-cluster-containing hydrogenase components 1
MQCDNAACATVCPVGAITRDDRTGALIVNHVRCIKCTMCVNACPFGCSDYDSISGSIIKCDLCGGDPECAKNCPSGAISFQDINTANISKKKLIAAKFKELVAGVN